MNGIELDRRRTSNKSEFYILKVGIHVHQLCQRYGQRYFISAGVTIRLVHYLSYGVAIRPVHYLSFPDTYSYHFKYRQGYKKLKPVLENVIQEAYRVWGAHLVIFSSQLDQDVNTLISVLVFI
jgi:hypothetical protein